MARLLYRGCEPGMDVMELQDCLNNARMAVGEGSALGTLVVDGAFGAMTQGRVLEFQRGHGLAPDGVVGSKTWGLLEVVLSGVPGLEVRRPLGGGGNAGTGTGKGGPAYGKPESGDIKLNDAKQNAGKGSGGKQNGGGGGYNPKQDQGWGSGFGGGWGNGWGGGGDSFAKGSKA